ncbi:class I SAM-dependent methyltransferase [Saccharomonospora glauca]|jgi:2-polyprenyl-3-methyl-5-hydroxy-6-metoxy-1,4-benzoquinol methylase|uniref:Methylase involved in ubiquinone/menaquinone biosynthesis n=1 Tax=Saccharomonospora glauca K62 TaxID=928724 RepID=I1D3J6_9PSEU|nr:class I SAM-dependent methyltransferase [Saccharomonospora glauca]EIE99520.1 methylase involved in ubiquinone/menaquinone biosynthesis [Saccharomonospora glauca K62]
MTTTDTSVLDADRLEELLHQVITDVGAAMTVPLALVGDRLGLFTELAEGGPMNAGQLAERTGLDARYVQEWLLAMATTGYVTHDGSSDSSSDPARTRYHMSPEQAEAFTNSESPAYVAGAFQNLTAATRIIDRLTEAFRTGEGVGWHEHHEDLFLGTERFFRPSYLANLTSTWIPALSGVEDKLRTGARVADVGCGLGASTIIMAKEYPKSEFVGIDYHGPSIVLAQHRATEADVADRVSFRTAGATDLDGSFDFITFFDCLHDMPDPVGALRAAYSALADNGTVMLVEPMSWDSVEETLNPLGRLLVGASTWICLPSGLSAEPAYGLGNQAGPTRTCELGREAGFGVAREAVATDFNRVYELRK